MNIIEEISRSKPDSEILGSASVYSRNVFVAACLTPKEQTETIVYRKLASSYLQLMSKVTIQTCDPSPSFFPNTLQRSTIQKESPKGRHSSSLLQIKHSNMLSPELLAGLHCVVSLVSKSTKFELLAALTQYIKEDSSLSLLEHISKLLPIVWDAVKFITCSRHIKSQENFNTTLSVGNSSHGLDGQLYSVYCSMQKPVDTLRTNPRTSRL